MIRAVAILTLTFLFVALIPFVGPVVVILTPLPVLYYCSRLGRLRGLMVLSVSYLAAFGILGLSGQRANLPVLFMIGFTGVLLSEVLKRHRSVEKTFLLASSALFCCGAGFVLYHSFRAGIAPWQTVELYVAEIVRENIKLYAQLNISEEQVRLIRESAPQITHLFTGIFPALALSGAVFTVWVNLLAGRLLFRIHGVAFPDFGDLAAWKAPERLVWILIAAGGMMFVPMEGVDRRRDEPPDYLRSDLPVPGPGHRRLLLPAEAGPHDFPMAVLWPAPDSAVYAHYCDRLRSFRHVGRFPETDRGNWKCPRIINPDDGSRCRHPSRRNNMKVILKQNVESLGKAGDLVKVADGYARNFLVPKGLAAEANSRNLKVFEHEKHRILQQAEKIQKQAEETAARLSAVTCTIARRVGEQEKLFGSVGAKDIEEALVAQGIEIDKKSVLLDEPIKALGEFPVRIKLSAGVTGEIKVVVVAES